MCVLFLSLEMNSPTLKCDHNATVCSLWTFDKNHFHWGWYSLRILFIGDPLSVYRGSCSSRILFIEDPVHRGSCSSRILFIEDPVHILFIEDPVHRGSCSQGWGAMRRSASPINAQCARKVASLIFCAVRRSESTHSDARYGISDAGDVKLC